MSTQTDPDRAELAHTKPGCSNLLVQTYLDAYAYSAAYPRSCTEAKVVQEEARDMIISADTAPAD